MKVTDKKTVNLMLPVYNEERELKVNAIKLYEFLKESNVPWLWTITIVDNGSTDKTSEAGKTLAESHGEIRYIQLGEKGRGRALKFAMNSTKADVYCYMDLDLSTDLSHVKPLVDSILEGYDLAVGSRFVKGSKVKRSAKREILSNGYMILARIMTNTRISDLQCGFKAFSRRIVEEILPLVKDNEWFFDTELVIKADKRGYKIKEIPVYWTDSVDSRVDISKVVYDYLTDLWRLRSEI
jgi:glycosyltransferase involved in cell wall biosynthesis